jgi:predicted RNase H-like nuclease (RuvC/YqgF family)
MATLIERVTDFFSTRDDVIATRARTIERHTAEAEARAKAIAAQRAKVDKLREPERELARLEEEDRRLNAQATAELAAVEKGLRDRGNELREIRALRTLCARLRDTCRDHRLTADVGQSVTGADVVRNLPSLERRQKLTDEIASVEYALRDGGAVMFLPTAQAREWCIAARERLAALTEGDDETQKEFA